MRPCLIAVWRSSACCRPRCCRPSRRRIIRRRAELAVLPSTVKPVGSQKPLEADAGLVVVPLRPTPVSSS
eukprot:15486207-Heterocapsa_arctica.AAC.1